MQQAMSTTDETVWKVMVGNKKRWPESLSLSMTLTHTTLEARWHNREQNEVSLRWASTGLPFAAVVQEAGRLPLPPYLKREAEATDYERYQTVYAKAEGAVAAPTAGLHFTPEVMQQLAAKGIAQGFVTLHVGAGTFQPIQETHQGDVAQHPMHNEAIVVSQAQLAALLQYPEGLIPVGTTAMRSLESLYWFGVQLLDQQGQGIFHIPQLWAYTRSQQPLPSAQEALKAVQIYMQAQNLTQLQGYTEIMIMPGYQMRLCRGLITNYHQPQTTLILLVAALIGQDWRKVYQTALDNDYRFLSYGDSSLLLPRG
jgi:S-adenosylmethionine:tRNA ribosyltransferase-isomerase